MWGLRRIRAFHRFTETAKTLYLFVFTQFGKPLILSWNCSIYADIQVRPVCK
ncbi:hypothetical protein MJ8_59300 [Mesorhizobium sp. J8]|nr:hypothetical protein MJ8_59300 [Mesorhizobium sp. J8]